MATIRDSIGRLEQRQWQDSWDQAGFLRALEVADLEDQLLALEARTENCDGKSEAQS
jgi:hypothetical protein